MWSGGVIDTRDGHDLVNVVFQSMHLNKIMAGLEMSGPFRDLHRKEGGEHGGSSTTNCAIHGENSSILD
jgi:hypothetical protein